MSRDDLESIVTEKGNEIVPGNLKGIFIKRGIEEITRNLRAQIEIMEREELEVDQIEAAEKAVKGWLERIELVRSHEEYVDYMREQGYSKVGMGQRDIFPLRKFLKVNKEIPNLSGGPNILVSSAHMWGEIRRRGLWPGRKVWLSWRKGEGKGPYNIENITLGCFLHLDEENVTNHSPYVLRCLNDQEFTETAEQTFEMATDLARSGEKEASEEYLRKALRVLDWDPNLEERVQRNNLKYYSQRIEDKFLSLINSDVQRSDTPVKVAIVHDIDADGLSSTQIWREYLQERFGDGVEIVTVGKMLTDKSLLEDLEDIPYVLCIDNFVPEREGKRQNVVKAINESSKRGILILDHHDDEIGDLTPAQVESNDIPDAANIPESIFKDTENFTYVSPRARLGLNSKYPSSRYPTAQLTKALLTDVNPKIGWLVALGVYGDVFDSKIWWEDLCKERPCSKSMELIYRGLQMTKQEHAQEILDELSRVEGPEEITANPRSFPRIAELIEAVKDIDRVARKVAEENRGNDCVILDLAYLVPKDSKKHPRSPYLAPGTLAGALTLPTISRPAYFPEQLVGIGTWDEKGILLKISLRDNRAVSDPKYDTRRFLDRFGERWGLRGGGHAPASSIRCSSKRLDLDGIKWDAFKAIEEAIEEMVRNEALVSNTNSALDDLLEAFPSDEVVQEHVDALRERLEDLIE